MISVRVKTSSLEVAVSSPQDTLDEVVRAVVSVAESQPIQNSLHAPIIIRSLEGHNLYKPGQLPLLEDATASTERKEMKRKKLPNGKGERVVAYNKTRELIDKNLFGTAKTITDIWQALSKIGYTVNMAKLADALLMLVRDGRLVREGERGKYVYNKANLS